MRKATLLILISLLNLAGCCCLGIPSVRYEDCQTSSEAQCEPILPGGGFQGWAKRGKESLQPPHSRFHPLPTRPVFYPPPESGAGSALMYGQFSPTN